MSFNKYKFVANLLDEITTEIENSRITSLDDVHEFINIELDNAVIYYSDCFDICKELNATDFTAYEIECNTIEQLAYACLNEYVYGEIELGELDDRIMDIRRSEV
jgi:hypothetical protein